MSDIRPGESAPVAVRFRIGALLYFADAQGRLLLIRRKRRPNEGLWCAIGGKLEMPTGESPYDCAIREAREEVGVELKASELSLRCILSEKEYEGTGHWLMFVFQVRRLLDRLPDCIEEGTFKFFAPDELGSVSMPELDRRILRERILPENGSLHVLRTRGPGGELVEESKIGGDR